MSKRRVAGVLTGGMAPLKYPAKVTVVTSGTGTCTKGGVFTVVSSGTSVANMFSTGRVYLTMTAGQNVGTIVGTGAAVGTY